MGEIRIVGPGQTRGFPYPVCNKCLSRRDTPNETGDSLFLIRTALPGIVAILLNWPLKNDYRIYLAMREIYQRMS